jgi:hypothetical protein
MSATLTNPLGHPIECGPNIGPHGVIVKNDSLTADKLVELLT